MLKEEAKVGMKVVSLENGNNQLRLGDIGVIDKIFDVVMHVRFDNGHRGVWYYKRFAAADLRPAVGSRVHCVDPAGTKLKKLVVYIVTAHDADGVNIRIDGARNKMKASRFAIIPPVVIKQGPIEVGDLVRIRVAELDEFLKKPLDGPGWNDEMRELANIAAPVRVVGKDRWLQIEGNKWWWDEKWFEHVGAVHIVHAPPVAPPPPEVQKDVRAMLSKEIGTSATLCAMAWQFKDARGKFTEQISVGMPCHAALNRGAHGKEIVAVIYGISTEYNRLRKSAMFPIYQEYVHYMLNESPWAFAYLTKDVEEAFTKEIVMNVDIHRNHMAGACIALRAGQEYHAQRLPMFDLLVKAGVGKHASHLLAQELAVVGGSVFIGHMHGGHMELDRDRNFDDLLKFYKSGYHIPQDGTVYRHNAGGYVSAAAIASSRAGSFGKWIADNLQKTTNNAGSWNESQFSTVGDAIELGMLLTKLIEEA